jgi:hypothetical protein
MNGTYGVTGTTTISGGETIFNTDTSFGTLNIINDPNSVFLTAHANNTITGAFNWTGGQLRGSGTTTISPEATASFVGGTNTVLGGVGGAHRLINNATAPLALGGKSLFFNNGAVFENNGTFEVSAGAGLFAQTGGGTFRNNGTFIKRGANSTSALATTVALANDGQLIVESGTLQVSGPFSQTAADAETRLAGGTLTAVSLTFAEGKLSGAGTVAANVTSAAIVQPGGTVTGSITISGNYTQNASGRLQLDLGGTASGAFDQLAVTGTAALGGTLQITLIDGFSPQDGDTFRTLDFTSRNGTDFAVNEGLTGTGFVLTKTFTTTVMTLSAAAAAPLSSAAAESPTRLSAAASSPWPRSAVLDSDGDGATDEVERLAGTDPIDATSILQVTSIRLDGDNIILGFPSVVGRTYTVEFANEPGSTTWRPLQAFLAGTGEVLAVTDVGAGKHRQRFYRVQVSIPQALQEQ